MKAKYKEIQNELEKKKNEIDNDYKAKNKEIQKALEDEEEVHYNFKVPNLYPDAPKAAAAPVKVNQSKKLGLDDEEEETHYKFNVPKLFPDTPQAAAPVKVNQSKKSEKEDEEETHYNFKVPQLFPDTPTPHGTTGIAAKAAAAGSTDAHKKLVLEEDLDSATLHQQKAMSHVQTKQMLKMQA
jgi:hypothetical protein